MAAPSPLLARFDVPLILCSRVSSQPFWASVVAAAGAGPGPIPQKDLTVERLVDALNFALSPRANAAAGAVAHKMARENGVQAAVDSFHRWLPIDQLRCQVLPYQAARWLLEVHGKQARLSDAAVDALVAAKKIKSGQLRA